MQDILENPVLNGEEGGGAGKAGHSLFSTQTLGDIAHGGVGLLGMLLQGGKSLINKVGATFTEPSNSITIGQRLLITAAGSPEDKLKTLRQFYPDAKPDGNGDFTFFDPVRQRQMTMTDKGFSVGNLADDVPGIGEAVGMGVGAPVGAAGGGVVGSTGGPAGTVLGATMGGAGGAAAGGYAGKTMATYLAKLIGQMLTNGQSFDTRTPAQSSDDTRRTLMYDALGGLIPGAIGGTKAAISSKYLTPTSGALSDSLSSLGYKPSLTQIGSPVGAATEQKLINQNVGSAVDRAAFNENVLKGNTDNFLGANAGTSRNDLASALREGSQAKVGAAKDAASSQYENFPFSDTAVPPATQSKSIIQGIMGKQEDPAWSFDPAINYGLKKVMAGQASEADLNNLQSNIGTYLSSQKVYDAPAQSLKQLQGALRDDLVEAAPETAAGQQTARQGWRDYKNLQDQTTNLFGKQEGVSQGVGATEGLTEGQNLARGLKLFQNGDMGSDTKAASLGAILDPQQKQTMLAAILQQQSPKGVNPIQNATTQYNMERVIQNLVPPNEQNALKSLVSQAQGTTALSTLPPNVGDPLTSSLNYGLGTPQKWAVNSALKSAAQGYTPGNFPNAPTAKVAAGTGALEGMKTNSQEIPGYRISPQALFNNPQATASPTPSNLEMLLAHQPQSQTSELDKYLGITPPNPNQTPMIASNYNPLDHYNKAPTLDDLNNFIAQTQKPAPDTSAQPTLDDLNAFIAKTQGTPTGSPQGTSPQDAQNSAIASLQARQKTPVPPIVNQNIPAATAALLKTISGPGLEGAGYNTIVGGGQFNDMSDHPNQVGVVTRNGPSTAAGRYQITHSTWNDLQNKHSYNDFSPASQDQAASDLATDVYSKKTGRDLASDLATGDPNILHNIGNTLSGTWTSLPGGIEQGSGANGFVSKLVDNLNSTQPTLGDLNNYIKANGYDQNPQSIPPPTAQNINSTDSSPIQLSSDNLNDYL